MHVLIVEGDADERRRVRDSLGSDGIDVTVADRGPAVLEPLATGLIDLVILGMNDGSTEALDLLKTIRADGDVPVIVLLGPHSSEIDRVVALELGADDCLAKPVALRELLARIRTILRRTVTRFEPGPTGTSCFRGWTLDRRLRTLHDSSGSLVKLTKSEYALLVAFLNCPGRPLSREHLLSATRVYEDIFDRSIDVQILRLRRKLETDPAAPKMIVTERGLGYLFAAIVEAGK